MSEISPPPLDGRSWLPLLRGDAERLHEHALSRWSLGGAEEWALRTPEVAFLLPVQQAPTGEARPPQLYRKPEDRWELNNVLQHHLEQADEYERTLRGIYQPEA